MAIGGYVTGVMLIWSVVAYADLGGGNKEFVDHLQYYYQVTHIEDLNLRIVPKIETDEKTIYTELRELESVLFDSATMLSESLPHLACSRPECGGCGHSVCALQK